LRSLQQVVKTVLKDMIRSKEPIPQPLGKRSFSGRLNVRMPSYLHRHLAIEAAQQSVSLNQLINLKLEAPLEMAAHIDTTAREHLRPIVMFGLIVILLSFAAIPCFAEDSVPSSDSNHPVQDSIKKPRIGVILNSTPPDGCGCSLQFPSDYRKHNDRYVFRRDFDGTGKVNIDGQNVELTTLHDKDNKGEVRAGDRFFEIYSSGNVKVRIDYIVTRVCNPNDEGCEVTWYSATIAVTRNGSSQTARVLGVCGC